MDCTFISPHDRGYYHSTVDSEKLWNGACIKTIDRLKIEHMQRPLRDEKMEKLEAFTARQLTDRLNVLERRAKRTKTLVSTLSSC